MSSTHSRLEWTVSPERLLERRWDGPYVTSFAQNAEDVRLWRLFADSKDGFYVDVGAGDPVVHSVTKLFYDAGWSGINVEPGPSFARLDSSRPRDVNLAVAVTSTSGDREMWFSSPDPGLSSLVRPPDDLLPPGFETTSRVVRASRLDAVVRDHAKGRHVDFLKIDVEGAERDVLESFDPAEIRPTVIVVEAISPLRFRPTHQDWESLLLERDYVEAAFDGINRFYVPREHEALASVLAYPVSVLDRFVLHDFQWRRDSSAPQPEELEPRLPDERSRRIEREAHETRSQLEAMKATLSWRITRPLRVARRLRPRKRRDGSSAPPAATHAQPQGADRAAAARLLQAASLLDGHDRGVENGSLEQAFERLELALSRATCSPESSAWLALVACDGRYPGAEAVDGLARTLRLSGAEAVIRLLRARVSASVESGLAPTSGLDIVRDGVVVLVEAMVTTDLHTGIQRVARECISRWLEDQALVLAHFDPDRGVATLLSDKEHERIRQWRDYLADSGATIEMRRPEPTSGHALVPWNCRVVVTELLLDREHCNALRTLATTGVLDSLGFVGFDLIPIVAPETVYDGLTEQYCDYLSALKRADRVSAISRRSALDFTAYASMLEGEGLAGPRVEAHPLPTVAPALSEAELAAGLVSLDVGAFPLVLVVGVHVPRKNHVAILEAADRLWSAGTSFELLFVGGMDETSGGQFDGYVDDLRARGRPVRVRRRSSEGELWAAYRAARFTVYPSLLEGFGLPIAESLASGTPVVASSHGAMAEIASGGGALLVDPRDVDDLEGQMRRLLTDDELLERLEGEARGRDFGSWDRYAEDVWSFLVGNDREQAG